MPSGSVEAIPSSSATPEWMVMNPVRLSQAGDSPALLYASHSFPASVVWSLRSPVRRSKQRQIHFWLCFHFRSLGQCLSYTASYTYVHETEFRYALPTPSRLRTRRKLGTTTPDSIPQQASVSKSSRKLTRNGKIARLPYLERDMVNRMLRGDLSIDPGR